VGTDHLLLKEQAIYEGTVFIEIPESDLTDSNETVELGIYQSDKEITSTKTHFLSPKNKW
ncbi:hypothetical protein, partial [Saccharophagus degradans]